MKLESGCITLYTLVNKTNVIFIKARKATSSVSATETIQLIAVYTKPFELPYPVNNADWNDNTLNVDDTCYEGF